MWLSIVVEQCSGMFSTSMDWRKFDFHANYLSINWVKWIECIDITIRFEWRHSRKFLIWSAVFIVVTCHEEPNLHHLLMRKYWINLFENACGSCLDIYLSGGERIYYRIYYFWIYGCLKYQIIAVHLTEVSSLTILEEGNNFSLFWVNLKT